jgi:putative nucleotidyltransferase with HDIG domain
MKGTALRCYVAAIVLAGGAVVVHAVPGLVRAPHLLEWALFALLAVLSGSFMLHIASINASIGVNDTFFIATALLFGPGPAAVILATDTLIFSWRKGHSRERLAFNTAAPALSLWVGGQVFFFLAQVPPLSEAQSGVTSLIVPLLCLVAIYFVLNSGFMAIAVGLESGQSPFEIWRRHFLWLSQGYFASGSVAFCLILIIRQAGLLAVAVILPVIAIYHRTLGASFGRLEDARGHLMDMDRLYRSTVETLAMAIDAKDDVTHSHVRRVQAYAVALARELDVTDEPTVKAIEAAALLHDTGKLGVPEHILNKPGGLTPAEFEQMKRHVDVGADILSLVDFPFPVVPIVRCHHENWNGTGYPRGVTGEDIPIGARILSVVDCFDALTSDRPYRKRLSNEAALDILRERRGSMYDPRVVDTFMNTYRSVTIEEQDAPEYRQVLEQISLSKKREEPKESDAGSATADVPVAAVPDDLLAFVSLARLASGNVTLADVLALATNLVRRIVPSATGGWYLKSDSGDRLIAVDAFGPAAESVRGMSIRVGDKLTGWVAANRQVIVNSDAALDLGERALCAVPALKCCLSVPLITGRTVVGVLTLYGSDREAFTEDAGRVVQMVAPQVAQALAAATERSAARFATASDLKLVSSR